MKTWLKDMGISYRALAAAMGQSASSVSKKINGLVPWQQSDLLFLHNTYGLSSDFVLGLKNAEEATTPLLV
ncbi:transcriptional regulator [Bifidobacterium aemilianum]|uniref:Transcriptional regulator n=1 Tax=Bifidobacterium aemilianum TaxID=2493120 RepID=A0A366K887_9BIFI|nr:helix-turn-helix domain-containing protein [Bifidobacterium aemilianum]RBP97884.1 transcriptional regulator [Bifidobacterium aemilianum]